MSYKIGALPTKNSYVEEIADYWEIQALIRPGSPISKINILKIIACGFDENYLDGIDSEEDFFSDVLLDVRAHIECRMKYTNENYPFELSMNSIKYPTHTNNEKAMYIYTFLLLCTRFDMSKDKIKNSLDATEIFEFLCVDVSKNYLGENSDGIVFGTGESGGFREKIETMIKKIGAGGSYKNIDESRSFKKDDGVDIVAWKNFADGKKGKLIAFGQCKTGTSWRDGIKKLRVTAFCKTWLTESFILEPIPVIFLADTMNENFHYYLDQQEYLVFNRFRIMEYALKNLNNETYEKIKKWVVSAVKDIIDNSN